MTVLFLNNAIVARAFLFSLKLQSARSWLAGDKDSLATFNILGARNKKYVPSTKPSLEHFPSTTSTNCTI